MPRSSSGVAAPFCPHFHIPASGRSLESHVCSEPCPASGKKRKALACKRVALISACGTGLAASGSSRAAGGGGGGTRGETRWQPPSTACSKGRSISLPPGQVDGVKGPMQSRIRDGLVAGGRGEWQAALASSRPVLAHKSKHCNASRHSRPMQSRIWD